MAKRKSNRAARQTLDMDCWLSNRRAAVLFSFGYSPVKTKPSRSQRRNDKRRFEWLHEHASTDCDYIGIADHNPQFHC